MFASPSLVRRASGTPRRVRAAALTLLALPLAAAPSACAASTPVNVFPSPGARVAPLGTQITFRGVPIAGLGSVSVVGSRTGRHTGRLLSDSDGQGGSFLPTRPFAAAERVTVTAGVPIAGGSGDSYSFLTATPSSLATVGALPTAPRIHGDLQGFASRPDLHPPTIHIVKPTAAAGAADGDVFVAPQNGPLQNGPMLIDPQGRLIWFKPVAANTFATDFRVQTLGGASVLTWWQGHVNAGIGTGEDVVYNNRYRPLHVIKAGNGLQADLHEFQLTSAGTALISSYFPVISDASSVHASRQATVLDSVVQEIDIPTGLVLFQWDSLDHVPLTDSYANRPKTAAVPFDYFHINSIQQDTDGNFVVSGRNVWAGYKIDQRTGQVIWTLGGHHSSFKMATGAQFAFQHDIRVRSASTVSVFDDGAGDTVAHRQSRGLILSLDFQHRTAQPVAVLQHSPSLLAFYEGNMQQLPSGDYELGWGQQPYFTDFSASGQVVSDARFLDANSTYRAYRFPWSGSPAIRPGVAAVASGSRTAVYASWNGATGVTAWRVLGGASPSALTPRATTSSQGFETRTALATQSYFAVQALGADGAVLAQSAAVKPH